MEVCLSAWRLIAAAAFRAAGPSQSCPWAQSATAGTQARAQARAAGSMPQLTPRADRFPNPKWTK